MGSRQALAAIGVLWAMGAGPLQAQQKGPPAVRVDLADGATLTGLFHSLDPASLTLLVGGRPARYELSAVRAVSFGAEGDFWRDGPRIPLDTPTIVFRDGRVVGTRELKGASTSLAYRTAAARGPTQVALRDVRRIYLNPRGLDFGLPRASTPAPSLPPGLSANLTALIRDAQALQARLRSTAHRSDPAESQTARALGELALNGQRALQAFSTGVPSSESLFRLAEGLAAALHEVDVLMDSLGSYPGVQDSWTALRQTRADDAVHALRSAVRSR